MCDYILINFNFDFLMVSRVFNKIFINKKILLKTIGKLKYKLIKISSPLSLLFIISATPQQAACLTLSTYKKNKIY